LDSPLGDSDAELQELATDALGTPRLVLHRHSSNEFDGLLRDPWPRRVSRS
jgi:hypothetical protein